MGLTDFGHWSKIANFSCRVYLTPLEASTAYLSLHFYCVKTAMDRGLVIGIRWKMFAAVIREPCLCSAVVWQTDRRKNRRTGLPRHTWWSKKAPSFCRNFIHYSSIYSKFFHWHTQPKFSKMWSLEIPLHPKRFITQNLILSSFYVSLSFWFDFDVICFIVHHWSYTVSGFDWLIEWVIDLKSWSNYSKHFERLTNLSVWAEVLLLSLIHVAYIPVSLALLYGP